MRRIRCGLRFIFHAGKSRTFHAPFYKLRTQIGNHHPENPTRAQKSSSIAGGSRLRASAQKDPKSIFMNVSIEVILRRSAYYYKWVVDLGKSVRDRKPARRSEADRRTEAGHQSRPRCSCLRPDRQRCKKHKSARLPSSSIRENIGCPGRPRRRRR